MPKYKIKYLFQGEIELEADNKDDALEKFHDGVGFSNDDLYEGLGGEPHITIAYEMNGAND